MNIGQLARLAGVPIDTVRYYERQQLLPPPSRTPRRLPPLRRLGRHPLTFIRRAKALGFTLDEVRDLLDISAGREDMGQMKAAAASKLAVVEERLAEMTRMRDALRTLVDACPGHGDLSECPIVAALAEEPK